MLKYNVWSRGQAVKTPPFHGGIRGSIPLGTTKNKRKALGNECFFIAKIYYNLKPSGFVMLSICKTSQLSKRYLLKSFSGGKP